MDVGDVGGSVGSDMDGADADNISSTNFTTNNYVLYSCMHKTSLFQKCS